VPGTTLLPTPSSSTSVDVSQAVTLTGEPGDVLFFGPYAVHGSLPNTSSTPRRVLINGYAAPGVNGRVYPGSGLGQPLP
jgi:ectoine hydroxylase-related dioxygenase (phytanoyl-CoA dioxygenase family)